MEPSDDELEEAERREVYLTICHFVLQFSRTEMMIRSILALCLRIPRQHFNIVMSAFDFAQLCRGTKAACQKTDRLDAEQKQQMMREGTMAPRPQYWFNVSLGRSNIYLSNIANTTDGKIAVRVYIRNKVASAALPQLEAERSAIEAEIGEKLDWNPNPEAIDKVIKLERTADLSDHEKWPEYVTWLVEKTDKFKKAFGPRVKKLDLGQLPAAPSA